MNELFFLIGTKSSKNTNGKQIVIQFTIVENFKVFNNGDSSIEIFPGQNTKKSIHIVEVFNATSDSRERHFKLNLVLLTRILCKCIIF